jgi:hypothetical protein
MPRYSDLPSDARMVRLRAERPSLTEVRAQLRSLRKAPPPWVVEFRAEVEQLKAEIRAAQPPAE